jgi:hypothetical protein
MSAMPCSGDLPPEENTATRDSEEDNTREEGYVDEVCGNGYHGHDQPFISRRTP